MVKKASTISGRKQKIIDLIDEQIAVLDSKLAKYQPLFDERSTLLKSRAMLMNEKGGTGKGVTTGQVRDVFEKLESASLSAPQIADELGMNQSTVRSHLSRHAGVHYEKGDDGTWSLLEEDEEEE